MKKNIITILMATLFAGCLPEGDAGCPEYLSISFELQDQYESGDFDSRIANDVQLYVFRDGICVYGLVVPYEDIRDEKEFTFRKTLQMHGDLDLVAWSVASNTGDPSSVPDWLVNDELDRLYLELPARTGPQDSTPMATELYNGSESFSEVVDVSSSRRITLGHTACRVEVNVTSTPGFITSNNPRVAVHGSMNRMDMDLNGFGEEAVVHTSLLPASSNNNSYSTGRFGILPSAEYQTIAVEVYDGNDRLAILRVPRDNISRGAKAGDLIIFDYEIGEAEFWLTVNGFRQKIVILDGM